MNLTRTVEVIRKPALNAMAMLSLLGDERHPVRWEHGDRHVQPATPWSAPYGALASSRRPTAWDGGEMAVLLLLHNSMR